MTRIAVLGAGTMGCGIAELFAMSEHNVTLVDVSEGALSAGMDRIRSSVQRAQDREGHPNDVDADAVHARIEPTTELASVRDCTVVIESVTEDLTVKSETLARVSEMVDRGTLIASNTSGLSVTEIGNTVDAPERFVGLHFFNPAPRMPLVEVVRALRSSDDEVERAVALIRSLGKETVVVDDRPGFLVNRLLMPYLNQCIQEYDDGLASMDDIDAAVRLGLGYPMGPFELLDLIGLDTHEKATRTAYEQTADPHLAPPPLLQRMVAAGWYGRKSERGFRSNEVSRHD